MRNRLNRVRTMAVALVLLTPVYVAGQGRGGAVHPVKTTHGPTARTQGPSTTARGTSKTAHGPSATHGKPKATTTTTTARTHGKARTTTASTSTSGSGTTTGTIPNPIAQKIGAKPQLSSKVTKMLPPGMTLQTASAGFKNQGQFIAALHVSQNLNIPFKDLKAAMLGTTPSPTTPGGSPTTGTTSGPMSLGQAIKKLRPSADAGAEAAHAETQTSNDVGTRR